MGESETLFTFTFKSQKGNHRSGDVRQIHRNNDTHIELLPPSDAAFCGLYIIAAHAP